eukprot:5347729-Ditylum_brightwellii.AAC.1
MVSISACNMNCRGRYLAGLITWPRMRECGKDLSNSSMVGALLTMVAVEVRMPLLFLKNLVTSI